jgi:hypothetical protein
VAVAEPYAIRVIAQDVADWLNRLTEQDAQDARASIRTGGLALSRRKEKRAVRIIPLRSVISPLCSTARRQGEGGSWHGMP